MTTIRLVALVALSVSLVACGKETKQEIANKIVAAEMEAVAPIMTAQLSAVAPIMSAQMAQIGAQMAADQEAQYAMVAKAGDKMQMCVQAGMVEMAYLQAKDEANFAKWNAAKKADCKAAGMPQ